MTFWPVAAAVQKGDGTGLSTLATVLAGLGSNLLASYIDKWKGEADAARQIEQLMKTEPALRAELDALLEKFDVFSQATQVLRDADRQWFTDTLRAELSQFGGRLRADAWYLPDEPLLGFVKIPTGPFLTGEGKEQHEVFLPRYYISRYPVTVAQFRAFVESLREEEQVRYAYCLKGGLPNHPVVKVTWHDALAYCRWLTKQLREHPQAQLAAVLRKEEWEVTLPSEAEWEKAARSDDGRRYPWGDEFDATKANVVGTGIDQSTAVGCFPGGKSPYELLDMAGNVWEWTRSLWEDENKKQYDYPYEATDGRENLNVPDSLYRVLRGCAFWNGQRSARCAYRNVARPGLTRYDYGGFRVVVLPKTLDSENSEL
jgi:formylglycine-generating enzyme required for sulfatase activity